MRFVNRTQYLASLFSLLLFLPLFTFGNCPDGCTPNGDGCDCTDISDSVDEDELDQEFVIDISDQTRSHCDSLDWVMAAFVADRESGFLIDPSDPYDIYTVTLRFTDAANKTLDLIEPATGNNIISYSFYLNSIPASSLPTPGPTGKIGLTFLSRYKLSLPMGATQQNPPAGYFISYKVTGKVAGSNQAPAIIIGGTSGDRELRKVCTTPSKSNGKGKRSHTRRVSQTGFENGAEFPLFPNPTVGNATLVVPTPDNKPVFRVLDPMGRTVEVASRREINGEVTQIHFDLSGLSAGLFRIFYQDNDQVVTRTLVKR